MKPILPIFALILSACATSQEHKDAVANDAMAQCARMGYVAQSPEWRQCAQNLYLSTMQTEASRRALAAQNFTNAAAALSQPQPTPQPSPAVLCRNTYMGVVCQ